MNQNNTKNLMIVLVVVLVLVLGYVLWPKQGGAPSPTPEGNGTTSAPHETTNPNPPQQTTVNTSAWKIYADSKMSFVYPPKIGVNYVKNTNDWPPKIQVINQAFVCNPSGWQPAQAGQTTDIRVGGKEYCLTKESEGAAGTTYTNYTYAFAHDNQTGKLTFSLGFPQCMNYPEPQQSACKNEQSSLDINSIAATIAQSLQIK